MLYDIQKLNSGVNSVTEFIDCIRQGENLAVFGVNESFKNYLVSKIDKKVLFIVKDLLTAKNYQNLLNEMCNKNVVLLPAKDEVLVPSMAFSKDTYYERVVALSKLNKADIFITTSESVLQPCVSVIEDVTLKKGQSIAIESLIEKLVELGYTRCESVESKGYFSIRGDIVDVFPISFAIPVKLDFFGDEIENIKEYDIESRKVLSYRNEIKISSSKEGTLSNEEKNKIKAYLEQEVKSSGKDERDRLKCLLDDFITAVEKEDDGYLSIYSFLSVNSKSIFDIIDKDTVIVLDEAKRINEICLLYEQEFLERFKSLLKDGAVSALMKNALFSVDYFRDALQKFTLVALQTLSTSNPFFNPQKTINPQVSGTVNYRLDFKEIFNDVNAWMKTGYSVLLYTGDKKRAENLSFELSGHGIASIIDSEFSHGVNIYSSSLDSGFIFHEEKVAVIGSGNLYGKPTEKKKVKLKKQAFFSAPETGDYAVHEIHGIGRVLGSKKITSTEGTKDYVAVEYYGGDILYVPVEQMDILTRYLGAEQKPKLSKIGGKDFEYIKQKVRDSIKKMSFDLKKLYEERNALSGFAFKEDKELQQVFISNFPFEDTADQITATKEIEEDMSSPKVMDRLICGDVGFGKTEVAFRGAFRAIVNGKQVAMLAPTTILTEQHYHTALERFKGFGINIAVINRFKTPKEQKEIIEKLKQGKIDFIIGTHRLLGKDIAFYDLGLLILDEEQRFGVEHKEKIKLLKKNVDTLTLSATPIPRTLHMALSGIRSISTINTPPKKRLPVQTYITEETDTLIKDAVLKEVNRGGQVFILYNRVESILSFAKHISDLLPTVRIVVAHGQMEERTMEKNVMDFYNGEKDLLISTTIIENGIDLPKANTLIVIDADKLGLSTLYQLKGRVGRSDRLAYAYFTFKKEKILTQTAYERLNAIIEFTEMGSGIKIAMRDLEIRGAGNVLGVEQHGHMDKIGYELYSKLLKEELTGETKIVPELDIRVTAYIPDDYIESNSARMDMYKEIAELTSIKEEKELLEVLKENYGEIPEETIVLIDIALVKRLAEEFNVSKVDVKNDEQCFVFENFKDFGNEKLQRATEQFSESVYISMAGKPTLNFRRNGKTNIEILKVMKDFLIFAVNN